MAFEECRVNSERVIVVATEAMAVVGMDLVVKVVKVGSMDSEVVDKGKEIAVVVVAKAEVIMVAAEKVVAGKDLVTMVD